METPSCPDKRHKNSTVVRAGWYGREGQRRQRWWCQPKTGAKHRFTETLPRITTGTTEAHACPECQTTLEAWEGQPAPRLYGFAARDVAWALAQVAGGATYRSTAAAVRARAGRELEKRPGTSSAGKKLPPATQHGQLVSDWVDVFAPVIWAAHAPKTWPEAVLADEALLKYSTPGKAGGTRAFYVLAAIGYDDCNRPYVAALEAVPRLSAPAWDRFLRGALDRQPGWVVTDGGGAIVKGVRKAWPDAEMWRCEWHLRKNLEDKLPAHVRSDPTHPIRGVLKYAQVSVANWEEYREALAKVGRAEPGWNAAQTAAANLDSLIRTQASSRPQGELPVSTGPLEQFFNTLANTIGDRSAKMTNKRRADALLKLLAAQRNGWVSEDRWTAVIRRHLEERRGRAQHQRLHTDLRSSPSLR